MTSPRKPSHAGVVIGIALSLVLVLYVGAYYLMVIPVDFPLDNPPHVYAMYPKPMPLWHLLFSPVNQLDRRIRPHVWEP